MCVLVVKISPLLCFLNGLGIAVLVFKYRKHLTRSSIVSLLYHMVAEVSNFMKYC